MNTGCCTCVLAPAWSGSFSVCGGLCRVKPQDQGFTEKRDPEPKSMSTGAQYVILDNKIKCLGLAFFLATSPIKP